MVIKIVFLPQLLIVTIQYMKRFLFSLLAAVALVGCGSKEEDKPIVYSAEEAKASIRGTMDSFYNCLKKANDGGFANVLFELIKDSKKSEGWGEYIANVFYNQYETKTTRQGFNYEGLKGTYTWNPNSKEWNKEVSSNSSNITWLFPATASSTTNNGRAVLSGYSDVSLTVKGEEERFPTKGNAVVIVDNEKVAEVNLNNITYKLENGYVRPTAVDLKIYTNPFTTILKVDVGSGDEYVADFSFSSPEGCTTRVKAVIKLTTSDLNSVASIEEAIDNIRIVAVQNDLQVVAHADVKAIHKLGKKLSELTNEEINTYAKAEVFKNGAKIADVKHEFERNNENVVYFIFSDGSKVKAEEYITDFEKKVTDIFKRFFNNSEE